MLGDGFSKKIIAPVLKNGFQVTQIGVHDTLMECIYLVRNVKPMIQSICYSCIVMGSIKNEIACACIHTGDKQNGPTFSLMQNSSRQRV